MPTETVSRPATTGPASRLTWSARRDTASPAASRSGGSSRAVNDRFAGDPAAPRPVSTAATTKTAARGSVSSTRTASTTEATSCPARVTSTSRRRSNRSASEPPSSAPTTVATSWARPIAPTSAGSWVRAQT